MRQHDDPQKPDGAMPVARWAEPAARTLCTPWAAAAPSTAH